MYIIGLTYLYGRLQMFHISCISGLSRNGPVCLYFMTGIKTLMGQSAGCMLNVNGMMICKKVHVLLCAILSVLLYMLLLFLRYQYLTNIKIIIFRIIM